MVFGWLIPSLFVMTIAASLAELTSAMPYVRRSCYPHSLRRRDADCKFQNERRFVLLFCETRPATVGSPGELDHRMGECHWTSGARVLDRLHLVSELLLEHLPLDERS